VVLRGHKTSISVEDAFWNSVKEIAASGQMSVSELISAIDSERHHGNLSSSIRLFVLKFYREQLFDRLDVRDKRKAIQRLISVVCEPIMGFLSRLSTITTVEAAPPPPHPGARISQNLTTTCLRRPRVPAASRPPGSQFPSDQGQVV
jgi:predicted DNA-binding ribbon-helix-helix protein